MPTQAPKGAEAEKQEAGHIPFWYKIGSIPPPPELDGIARNNLAT
tara:strand:- start:666 stop:800 length:135 start_codon:yes stop_codon:yes gene_type:complete